MVVHSQHGVLHVSMINLQNAGFLIACRAFSDLFEKFLVPMKLGEIILK